MLFPPFFSKKSNEYYKLTSECQLTSKEEVVPVVNGIPRFVQDGSYASSFGDQWKEFKKTQFDSFTKTSITLDRLNRCLGPLQDKLVDKLVLETGCGAGRFTEILLKKGAILVSSDISSAAEVNNENFPSGEKHLVIQADINRMPFKDESFDVVICLGVIQHTPDPEQTIENLYKLVRKGGYLVIDHYTFSKSWLLRSAAIYRWFLKRKKPSRTIPYTRKLVRRYLPLHKKFRHMKLASVLLNRISPVVSYYDAFPQLNEEHQVQWALLDTHDSLTDWYKHFRGKKSIYNTLKRLGADEIYVENGGNGVEARCSKPAA
ncbi:MAG TPA: class I SAM-dependent methyltransferase [Chitinophagaceae bacterium]|nr:class I SAM-dependent methyltransferase [Chitinophagaceae bacterium]